MVYGWGGSNRFPLNVKDVALQYVPSYPPTVEELDQLRDLAERQWRMFKEYHLAAFNLSLINVPMIRFAL